MFAIEEGMAGLEVRAVAVIIDIAVLFDPFVVGIVAVVLAVVMDVDVFALSGTEYLVLSLFRGLTGGGEGGRDCGHRFICDPSSLPFGGDEQSDGAVGMDVPRAVGSPREHLHRDAQQQDQQRQRRLTTTTTPGHTIFLFSLQRTIVTRPHIPTYLLWLLRMFLAPGVSPAQHLLSLSFSPVPDASSRNVHNPHTPQ